MRLEYELAKQSNLKDGTAVSGPGVHAVHKGDQVGKVHGAHQRKVSNISRKKSLLLVDGYAEQ